MVSEDGLVPSVYDRDHMSRPSHAQEGSPPEAEPDMVPLQSIYEISRVLQAAIGIKK